MGMTAICADRMRQGGCGDCARVDPCKALFARLFGQAPPAQRRAERPAAANPFLSFLGEVARSLEAGTPASESGGRPPARRKSASHAAAPSKAGVEAPSGSFRRELEQRLEPMLERGPVRIDEVARALGYSRQTLYRRLKDEDVTFAELLDALRHRLALRYLRERGMSVKETAYRLGFSEPAAFSRAYKRWTGSSPRRMDS